MSLRYLGGIIKPSYNPLAANVTVSPTVVQTGGVYTLQQQAQAQGQQQWSHDPYFNNTTLLLHADNFANGSQNNTFLNTPPGGVGSYTGSFNGSTQYLSAPNNSAFDFGTGDFTIEGWFYKSSQIGPVDTVVTYGWTSTTGGPFVILYNGSNQLLFFASSNGSSWDIANSVSMGTFTTGQWVHFAVSRQGSSIRLFLNGALNNTVTSSASLYVQATYPLTVGGNGNGGNKMNGYISNIRLVKGTAVYTAAFTPPTSPLTAISGTSLLTCQSATFVDNSTNNFTITNNGTTTIVNPNSFPAITRNGTPTQGTFTPYGDVWSNYFPGGSDYLTAPANAAFNFGTGDFTIEAWVYIAANSSLDASSRREALVFATLSGTSYGIVLTIDGNSTTTGTGLSLYTSNASSSTTGVTGTIPQQTWNHIAVSRSGSSVYYWLNGIQMGATQSITGNWGSSTQTAFIGKSTEPNYPFPLNGYISNLRVVKGTALYTARFNPSTTPLTAITNTSLLTCQSNRFVDNSTNAFAITPTGSPSVQRFAPFSPSSGYSPSVYSGSGYFNGSTDYLNTGATTAFDVGSGQFTVECWVYLTAALSGATDIVRGINNGSFDIYADTTFVQLAKSTVGGVASATFTLKPFQWYHIAGVQTASSALLFINGAQVGSGSVATFSAANGVYVNGISSGAHFPGYITDVRIVVGSAVYTSAFTPPSAPLTNIANTSLLLSYTNAGIYDNGMQNDLTTVSTAQVNTSVVKYGSGSMSFNGTSDYLNILPSTSFTYGAGNFTVECWFYATAVSSSEAPIYKQHRTLGAAGDTVEIRLVTNTVKGYIENNAVTSSTISANTWYHVAWVRASGVCTLYLNGVSQGSTTDAIDLSTVPTTVRVGTNQAAAVFFPGYIDDLRVTKGVARYLSNFTPPQIGMANQ